jgi:hypothetical protein
MNNTKILPILCITFFLVRFPQAAAAPEGHHQSGIFGQVIWSPYPGTPVQCLVRVETDSGELITTVQTDAEGSFRVALKPGSYLVTPYLPPDPSGVVVTGVTFLAPVTKKDYIFLPLFFTIGLEPFTFGPTSVREQICPENQELKAAKTLSFDFVSAQSTLSY